MLKIVTALFLSLLGFEPKHVLATQEEVITILDPNNQRTLTIVGSITVQLTSCSYNETSKTVFSFKQLNPNSKAGGQLYSDIPNWLFFVPSVLILLNDFENVSHELIELIFFKQIWKGSDFVNKFLF